MAVEPVTGGEQGVRRARRRRRVRKWLLWGGGFALALIVAVLLLAPVIAGSVAPGIIEGAAAESINGTVTVERTSFSWLGKQTIGPVTVTDDQGQVVAKLSIVSSRGLLSLTRSGLGLAPMDFGKLDVSGEALVVRYADGTTNLQRLIKKSGPSTNGGTSAPTQARLPRDLRGEVDVTSLNVRLVDQSAGGREIQLKDVTANAALGDGNVNLKLNAPAFAVEGGTSKPAGSLKADIKVTGFADATGKITPEAAVADATIDASNVSTEIAGVLTGIGQKLVDGVGETIQASIRAKGSLSGGDATVALTSQGVKANLALRSVDGVLTATSPGTISVTGPAAAAFVPMDKLKELRFEEFPGAEVTVQSLSVPMPASGKALDWRPAAISVAVKTSPGRGVLRGPDGVQRRIELGALDATIESARLADGATAKAQSAFALDGAPAGKLDVELTAKDLVDSAGGLKSGAPTLAGRANLTDLSTAAAQGFVEPMDLDLPGGIGPKLDVSITAAPGAEAGRTELTLTMKSAGLNGNFAGAMQGKTITTSGEASLRSPRTLAGKALDDSGLEVSDGGFAKVVVKSLTLDTSRPLESAGGEVETSFGGFSLRPKDAQATPIQLNQIIVTTRAAPGKRPDVALKGSGGHNGQNFFMQGELSLPEPAAWKGADSVALAPTGTIRLNNVPTSLASLAMAPAEGQLIADAAGPTATVTLTSAESEKGKAISLTAESASTRVTAASTITASAFNLSSLEARTTVAPETAARLIDRYAPGTTSAPTLAEPATLVLTAAPVTVPLKGLKPDLASAGELKLAVDVNGTLKASASVASDAGAPAAVTTLRDVRLTCDLPLSSLAENSSAKTAQAKLTAALYGDQNARIADLNGAAKVNLAAAKPVGDLTAALAVNVQDAKELDKVFGGPGTVSGAVGESMKLDSSVVLTSVTENGQSSMRPSRADLTIASPRIATQQPLKMTSAGDRVGIESPMVLKWTPDVAWLNTHALSAGPTPAANSLRVTSAPEFTVRLTRLSLPTGTVPMFAPGVFEADAEVSAPAVNITVGNSAGAIKSFAARATGGKETGVIGFSIRAEDLGSGGGPAGTPALLLQGGLYGIADAQGNPTFDQAMLSMNGDAHNAHSAVLDALANQGGVLAETLGPLVSVSVRLAGASRQSGTLVLTAASPRADMELKGSITRLGFVSEGEPKIVLHSMTPELGKLLVTGMPLIGTFEKKPEDGPAQVKAQGLVVPLDGKIDKLNGQFTIDLGTARFETSGVFGAVLRLARQRDAGMVGRRLEPLTLEIKNGVLTYQRWKIPLGEFSIDTRGTVDLVNKRMDLITYIPFGALSDEAAGRLNTGLGRLINGAVPLIEQATMVPFRTVGSYGEAKTEADLELFVKETGRTLLRPDVLIRDQIEKIFKRDEKPQDKK